MHVFRIKVRGSDQTLSLSQLPVLRQAFVVAGSLVWVGLALSLWVNSYFLFIPLLVGGGLLFSGLVGVCPMVAILNIMPWNRQKVAVTTTGDE